MPALGLRRDHRGWSRRGSRQSGGYRGGLTSSYGSGYLLRADDSMGTRAPAERCRGACLQGFTAGCMAPPVGSCVGTGVGGGGKHAVQAFDERVAKGVAGGRAEARVELGAA